MKTILRGTFAKQTDHRWRECKPLEGGEMAVVSIHGLAPAGAEKVLADVWVLLERYEIPSPKIEFDFHKDMSLTLVLHFEDPDDVSMVVTALQPLRAWTSVTADAPSPAICEAPPSQEPTLYIPLDKSPA
jgi:hypothetical protein